MKDEELFELCKEVCQKTEWGGTDYFFCSGNITPRSLMDDDDFLGEVIPLYTSDYLLEKLPRQIMGKSLEIYGFDEETGMYLVRYDVMELVPSNQGWYGARADTPLKALLRLVIRLQDAGTLK